MIVIMNLTQLVETIYNICNVQGSIHGHHKKKYQLNDFDFDPNQVHSTKASTKTELITVLVPIRDGKADRPIPFRFTSFKPA